MIPVIEEFLETISLLITYAVLQILLPARWVYKKAVKYALLLIPGFVILGFIFNLIGLKEVNLVFAIISAIVYISIGFWPDILLGMLALGVVSGTARSPQTISQETKRFWELYKSFLLQLMLWTSLVFFVLGTISFRENWFSFFAILAALILLGLMSTVWKMGGAFAKKLAWYYVVFMVILFALRLIPGGWQVRLLGTDLFGSASVTKKEETIVEINRIIKQMKDREGLAELIDIRNKLQDPKATLKSLSPDEQKIILAETEKAKERSAPSKVGDAFSRAFSRIFGKKDEGQETIDIGKLKGPIISSATSGPGLSIDRSVWNICIKEQCQEAIVEFRTKDNGEREIWIGGRGIIFIGLIKTDNEYVGTWSQGSTGTAREPFQISFDPYLKNGSGWVIKNGDVKANISLTFLCEK